MSKIPDVENELSLRSAEMKIPSQYDNVDWGKKKKLVNRKVSHKSSGGDHTVYGSKALLTKESTRMTFIDHLLGEGEDLTLLPQQVIGEIRSNIKKGAKDLTQNWKNALELVNKAYDVANVRRPNPSQKGAWKQYEHLIQTGVQALAQARGINGSWRTSQVLVREGSDQGIGKRRFFVEIPGESAQEVEGDDMDDIIDAIANKIRSSRDVTGTKVRVEERTKQHAVLSIWVHGVKRERIIVKQVS
jgi:hypothetical protein